MKPKLTRETLEAVKKWWEGKSFSVDVQDGSSYRYKAVEVVLVSVADAEIQKLQAEIEQLRKPIERKWAVTERMIHENTALRGELDAIRKHYEIFPCVRCQERRLVCDHCISDNILPWRRELGVLLEQPKSEVKE